MIKEFNSLEETQKYYDENTNTYIFKENGSYIDLVVFNFDLDVEANIDAGCIDAVNINAVNIKAWDVYTRDLSAYDIVAWNIYACNIEAYNIFAYDNIKCKSIKVRRENNKLKEEIKSLKCDKILNLVFGNYYELNPNTQQYEIKIMKTEKEI